MYKYFQSLSPHLKGTIICIAGILILTPDSLMIRLLSDVPDLNVQFIKFALLATTLFIPFLFYHQLNTMRKFVAIGHLGSAAGITWGISNLFFIMSAQQTYIGNLLVILASAPMFAAVFSYFLQHEIIKLRTFITCVLSFGIIAMVFLSDTSSTTSAPGDVVLGNIFALLSGVTLGLYYSLLHLIGGEEDSIVVQVNIISALVVVIVSAARGGFPTSSITSLQLGYFIINSCILLPLSFLLLAIGPKYISAPEVSLYMLIETITGPIWVFLGGYEKPPPLTIYGGIALLVILGVNSYLSFQDEQQSRFSLFSMISFRSIYFPSHQQHPPPSHQDMIEEAADVIIITTNSSLPIETSIEKSLHNDKYVEKEVDEEEEGKIEKHVEGYDVSHHHIHVPITNDDLDMALTNQLNTNTFFDTPQYISAERTMDTYPADNNIHTENSTFSHFLPSST